MNTHNDWTIMDYTSKFDQGLDYAAFLEEFGTDQHRERWKNCHEQIKLTPAQCELLSGFVREMKVMVLAGAWCGDCVNQCPILDHFAAASPKIRIRYFDRDAHPDLGDDLSICGAHRVPGVLFLSEDDAVCGRYGDRTLAKYRDMAAKQLGPACPTGIVAEESGLLAHVTQQWLDEFERIQLMLRLSGRLRKLHDD